jgi:hypothetical protein
MSYKAEPLGMAAPHVKAQGAGDTENGVLEVSFLACLYKGSSRSYPGRLGQLNVAIFGAAPCVITCREFGRKDHFARGSLCTL